MKGAAAVLLTTTSITALVGCGTNTAVSNAISSPPDSTRTLTVFAAASLQETFTTFGGQFETAHPGTTVRFSFGGSSGLVTQLQGGAPADVFASADTTNMGKATRSGLVRGTPVTFASNTLEIALPPGNPAKISSFADLTQAGIKLVVCAPAVPCGSATSRVETRAGVDLRPVSEESSVTDVLNKVETGEADAGLVYVTDVQRAGDKVQSVPFPESDAAVNGYPIATLTTSKDPGLAGEFVTLVTSGEGQRVLAAAGFAKP